MAVDIFAQSGPVDIFAGVQPQAPTQEPDGLGEDALNVLGELAASANRSVTEFIDFIGPDTANAVLSLVGSESRVPTLTGALEDTGIQGGFMEPGTARDVVRGAGSVLPAGGGLVQVPRNLAKTGGVVAEAMGIGSAKAPVEIGKRTAIELGVKRQTGDVDTAKHMIDEAGGVVKDPQAKKAIWQGFDEGLVAMVKASSPKTKKQLSAMVDVVEQGRKNYKNAGTKRPLEVVGKSVHDRIKVLWETNRVARTRLDDVAKSLRGRQVDTSTAVDSFMGKLDNMGIKYDPKADVLSFDGSDIEKLPAPQRVIRNVLNRMRNTQNVTAYDAHKLKKYIDNNVEYGKDTGGALGQVEALVKGLRHDIDTILDDAFPKYNEVNTQYAETRGALDAVQDVAGKRMDFKGENAASAIGTLTRRLLSNAQSRVTLQDALTQLDDVAKKYASGQGKDLVPYRKLLKSRKVRLPDFDEDFIEQVLFADELDKMFGTHAKTSLLGDVEKGVGTAVQGKAGILAEGAKFAAKKAAGINDENAIRAIRELLERDL